MSGFSTPDDDSATRSTTGHLDLNHRNQGARLMMMMMIIDDDDDDDDGGDDDDD